MSSEMPRFMREAYMVSSVVAPAQHLRKYVAEGSQNTLPSSHARTLVSDEELISPEKLSSLKEQISEAKWHTHILGDHRIESTGWSTSVLKKQEIIGSLRCFAANPTPSEEVFSLLCEYTSSAGVLDINFSLSGDDYAFAQYFDGTDKTTENIIKNGRLSQMPERVCEIVTGMCALLVAFPPDSEPRE